MSPYLSLILLCASLHVVWSIEYPATATAPAFILRRGSSQSKSGRRSAPSCRLLAADPEIPEEKKNGLYKKFADHAWEKLEKSGLFQQSMIASDLSMNEAPAKGTQDSVVRISTKALTPTENHQDLVRYARVAVLETISPSDSAVVQSAGIQVLNLVVFPSEATSLPVLGIDLVSLPGNRHLLLLDAQPMTDPNPFEDSWKDWYSDNVNGNSNFPWGGDFPEPVQKYVSKHALWTRLQELDDPVSVIESDIWEAFTSHLDIYLNLLRESPPEKIEGTNHQADYLLYRRNNDPAKPMLNALYGSEWTERILDEVLFPQG
jgi:hypothetical protein